MNRSCLVLAAAALVSTGAWAQTAATQSQGAQDSAFKTLDQDGSGSISMAEAQAAPVVQRSFTTADKNSDGTLSQEEFNQSYTIAPPAPQTEGEAPGSPPPQ